MSKGIAIVLLLLVLPGFWKNSQAQSLMEVKAKLNNQSFSYFVMDPGKSVKGILILFPGRGESAESVFQKTTLPYELARVGYLTIVPGLPYTLIADEFTIKAINQVLISQISKHESVKPNLVLGGFSAGGTIAISLAEHYIHTDSNSTVRGVFAIDPPLDLARLYSSAENMLQYDCQGLIRKEGRMTLDYLNRVMKGSPGSYPKKYLDLSPYSADDPRGGNAKYLENIPVRLYAEPDLEYVKRTYCSELKLSDINATDLEKLNKTLFVNGNSTCEYITTRGRGYHSWNILDVAEAIAWMEKVCTKDIQVKKLYAQY